MVCNHYSPFIIKSHTLVAIATWDLVVDLAINGLVDGVVGALGHTGITSDLVDLCSEIDVSIRTCEKRNASKEIAYPG